MKTQSLLYILETNGARLWAEGDKIIWEAPEGLITDDIRKLMITQKKELLTLLKGRKADDYNESNGDKISGDGFTAHKNLSDKSAQNTIMELSPDTIYEGHALAVLKTFPSESVDCVVTSPPYYQLRAYGCEPVIWSGDNTCNHDWQNETLIGQKTAPTKYKAAEDAFKPTTSAICSKCGAWKGELGGEPTPELFISHLCDIFDEVKRVLKSTGTCFVNLADSYDKKRSLVGIPEMFVLEMKKRGWTYRNSVVWHKVNCLPEAVKNRFTRDFEHVFFFTKKGTGYYFEQQLEPCSTSSPKDQRLPGVVRQRSYNSKYNRRDFRPGSTGSVADKQATIENCAVAANQKERSDQRNKRCVWRIPTANFRDEHFATFPEELVVTPILAGCPTHLCKRCGKPREKIIQTHNPAGINGRPGKPMVSKNGQVDTHDGRRRIEPGHNSTVYSTARFLGYTDCGCNAGYEAGVVLDLFAGAGTTCKVAAENGRRFIGIELNPKFREMALKRINEVTKPFDSDQTEPESLKRPDEKTMKMAA
jgi:DNA modification methylase